MGGFDNCERCGRELRVSTMQPSLCGACTELATLRAALAKAEAERDEERQKVHSLRCGIECYKSDVSVLRERAEKAEAERDEARQLETIVEAERDELREALNYWKPIAEEAHRLIVSWTPLRDEVDHAVTYERGPSRGLAERAKAATDALLDYGRKLIANQKTNKGE